MVDFRPDDLQNCQLLASDWFGLEFADTTEEPHIPSAEDVDEEAAEAEEEDEEYEDDEDDDEDEDDEESDDKDE